jgi:hypothetical protein
MSKQTKGNTMFNKDTKSANIVKAIHQALSDEWYVEGFVTDYELIEKIQAIVANATPPEINSIDQNTGLRYTTDPHTAILSLLQPA